MSHDRRCEWSKTSPRKCRCNCEGRMHGIQSVRERLRLDDQAEETSND